MCSEGVSVWFACKLCKSFFLNADDFAYHKKKSHIQEFQNTKFIVFEEQTSPTASPPENWVSFLSPKEETIIHKIISSPSPPPPKSNLDYNSSSENIQSNRSTELVEIDLEKNQVLIFNNHDNGSIAAVAADDDDVTNNFFALNNVINSYPDSDINVLQNHSLQSRVDPESAGCDFAGTTTDKQCSTVIKSDSLKISKQNSKNPVSSPNNVLQTVIQSPHRPHNPYVYLKRLNLLTIRNASHHSNSAEHPQENNRNHVNTNAEPANELKITNRDEEKFCGSKSTGISPPLRTTATAFENCKFCLQSFNSTVGLHVHERICHLKKQSENIVCIPCHLTFGSFDGLNEHNRTQHSTFIFTAAPESAKEYRTELGKGVKVAQKLTSVCNNSSETNNLPLPINHIAHVYKTDNFNPEFELHPVFNADADSNFNLVSNPTTEVNLNYGDLLEVVKTEYVADGNEDSECQPDGGVNQDSFESESRDNALAEETLILADNFDEAQAPAPRTDFHCLSCNTHFITVQEMVEHNKKNHVTQDGKKRFKCPYPNCTTVSNSHGGLKSHIRHVHSNTRPFKCSQPNCKLSFKTSSGRREHIKMHVMDESRRKFACSYPDCGKRSSTRWHLQRHIQHVHSNARPFKCPYANCFRSFKLSCGLKRHLKTHAKSSETVSTNVK